MRRRSVVANPVDLYQSQQGSLQNAVLEWVPSIEATSQDLKLGKKNALMAQRIASVAINRVLEVDR